MKFKKGGIVAVTALFIIVLVSGVTIYHIYSESFSDSATKLGKEAYKRVNKDLVRLKFNFLDKVIGEDECGNAKGRSERYTGQPCSNESDNDYSFSSIIDDCCCCNVSSHIFDFSRVYAYKDVKFEFVPHLPLPTLPMNTEPEENITVEVYYASYLNSSDLYRSLNNRPICTKEFNTTTDIVSIDDDRKEGLMFSCYISEDDYLDNATFRYVKLNVTSPAGTAIDYAKAKVYPALKICEVGARENLIPGKGYWVYSARYGEENVTIPGRDYMHPIALIDVDPHVVFTEEDVDFDGSNSFAADPGASITGYNWDFGDGDLAAGSNPPLQQYENSGIYKITLTVTDSDGRSGETSIYVTVLDRYPRAKFNITYKGFYSEKFVNII